MPLAETLAALKLGFQLVGGASNVSEIARNSYESLVTQDNDVGTVYHRIKELMEERKVLCDADSFDIGVNRRTDPVVSPDLQYLINLYGEGHNSGVIYVLYDKPGQGKTVAGRALLQNFYAFPSDDGQEEDNFVKGFMVTGQMIDEDYMSVLGEKVGATGVKGWIHALLLAMDRPHTHQPSILILDGFNSMGKDEVNLHFIKGLYGLINGKKNLFVVVATQSKHVADALCGLNGGQRIAPMPGCYSGDDKPSPNWKEEKWGRSLLIQAIRYEFNDDESAEKFGDDCKFEFISDDMTPLQATMAAARSLRRKTAPGSPKKLKMAISK